MRVTFDWIQLAAAAGALQGIVLLGVLLAPERRRAANTLLAALMAAFAVYLVGDVYYAAGLVRVYPQLFGISYPLPWVFGPLVYLYAVTASDTARGFKQADALHFLAPIAVVLATLPIYLMSGPEKVTLFDRLRSGDAPRLIAVLDPTKYVSGIAYSAATFAVLRAHARRVRDSYSNTQRVNLGWLLWLSSTAAAIWGLAVLVRLAGLLPQPVWAHSGNLVSLGIAVLIYSIGYRGLRQPEIYRYDALDTAVVAVEESPEIDQQQPRYERSGLDRREAVRLKTSLLGLMGREHPYRDPDLTLRDLADRLDTTPHRLSEVLNGELSQTFYDFVNGYRVEDVRRRLDASRSERVNVLTLAMDAGFASKSTFNQVFKKLTGQTPSSYRKALEGA